MVAGCLSAIIYDCLPFNQGMRNQIGIYISKNDVFIQISLWAIVVYILSILVNSISIEMKNNEVVDRDEK